MSALTVGVTGGIGSGKSALTDRLATKGIDIVDADIVAREVVDIGTPALNAIAERFGSDILLENGALNRAALRKIVFENSDQRQWLEALTHPLIGESIARHLATSEGPYVVLSSPLLLEGSQKNFVEHVVVVDVPEETQLQRTMSRDDNSEELVRSIMAAQLPRDERRSKADTIVDNSGSLNDLNEAADALHEKLLRLVRG